MRYLFLFIVFVGFQKTFAQKLDGEILDQLSREPVGFVQISTEKLQITSDENGIFSIEIDGVKNIIFSKTGYEELVLGVNDIIIENSKFIVELSSNTIDSDLESGIISLSDFDLSDDANSSDFASGQLSAYNDVFQSIAAYQFGIARFRQRGYDSRNNLVLMNGLELNKLYDGRPQWSNWGGLNDVLRNREYTKGLEVGNSNFGSINGSTNFILRTSEYQKGLRVSYSSTNTSYTNRILATYSGSVKGGWHYTVSASRRWAEEGHFDGTFYDANSFFLSVEKIMNEFHSLNFIAIYAKNRRGKSSPNTQEVYDLTSENYNSYWGWQGGKKRNSRVKNLNEPIFILSHNWDLNERANLKTSLLYQFGSMGNSRLNYSGGPNPDPSYYRKLPSYYLRNYSDRADLSDYALSKFTSQSNYNQLDWNFMYQSNMLSNENNRSVYMLYEDRVDDELVQLNSVMNYDLNDNFDFSVGINAKNLVSNNFAYSLDMLGGDYYVDTDSYRSGDQAQNDLNNPDRVIGKNDKFKYNFIVRSLNLSAFSNITYSNNKFSFFLSPKYSYRSLHRDGQFRNGVYPENSFGKGEKKEFYSLSGKAGIEYRITGRHIININGAYVDRPPTIRNSFSNSRENHNFVDNLDTEKIYSLEGSYSMNVKPIKLNVTGYYTNFQNMTEISFFFAQGLSGLEESSDFVSEIMGGTHRDHYGLEFGAESNITSTIKLSSGVAFGEYIYTKNPNLYLTSDDINGVVDYGTSFMKNYKVPGTPQRGYSFGIEHRDPKYWWVSANGNYLTHNYLDISPILRTNNFYINPDDPDGFPFTEANEADARTLLKQERFDNIFLLNLFGGKSWKIDDYYIGVILSVNNLLDTRYKSGGYEQSRNANYRLLKQDVDSGSRIFGPRYWYGYGRTYYFNIYFRF